MKFPNFNLNGLVENFRNHEEQKKYFLNEAKKVVKQNKDNNLNNKDSVDVIREFIFKSIIKDDNLTFKDAL